MARDLNVNSKGSYTTMLADARDFMIILWVFMQGFGWFHPESYGMFQAQVEQAYLEHADRLGYWEE